MADVAVVGAGLAGLVAARRLAEGGHAVVVYERRDEVGGRVGSRRVDGFTCDCGFQVLFTAYPAVRDELDLDALSLRAFEPGATVAEPSGRTALVDPLRAPRRLPSLLANPAVGPRDLLGLFALARSLRHRDPESLLPGQERSIREALADRGFSRRFVEAFAAPFYGGITLDRSLSTAAGVFDYTFKALSEGRAAVPADGMGAIPGQLARRARRAGAPVETGVEVRGLSVDGAGPDAVALDLGGETATADAAVVATDPPTALELTGVDAIPTSGRGCVTQHYALPSGAGFDPAPRLVLNAGGTEPNHVAPLSAVAPEYAPGRLGLLSATFLGQPEADDGTLVDRTRAALASWYPEADFGDLELVATDRVPFAQFEQPPGCHATLPAADAPDGPVVLAGDYTRWSSIQGALRSGREAAAALEGALA